jgi:hypothetical protein
MTPTEMARVILGNIEVTRALMEDGAVGYVLQFEDKLHLVCRKAGGPLRQDHPMNDDVAVYSTHAHAVTAQRWWNHHNPDDKVSIKLRREALIAYIDRQQMMHDTLLKILELEKWNTQ